MYHSPHWTFPPVRGFTVLGELLRFLRLSMDNWGWPAPDTEFRPIYRHDQLSSNANGPFDLSPFHALPSSTAGHFLFLPRLLAAVAIGSHWSLNEFCASRSEQNSLNPARPSPTADK